MTDSAPSSSNGAAGCKGAAITGVIYVLGAWIYLGRHAWDFDLPFFFSILITTPFALVIGAVSGGLLGWMFKFFRDRKYRLHLSSLLACVLLLAGFLALNARSTPGDKSSYGPSRFYGWPLPALGINYVEDIAHEVTPSEHNYYSWGLWGPGFVLDLTALVLALGAVAVALERLTDKRKNPPQPTPTE